ncbi:MAG: DUF4980 domain-containing protein [Bacteroidales bacterium]|nr:DUF4980 domain-containing protein [Bacteroidales bacterium]
MRKVAIVLVAILMGAAAYAQVPRVLSPGHAMLHLDVTGKYLILPVQESAPNSNVKVIASGEQKQSFNIKLAADKVDYFVPLDIGRFGSRSLVLDFSIPGEKNSPEAILKQVCWKVIRQDDSFDTTNRERFRPVYHHTPAYGWMNDPNGMFYKDGLYHLYYQWNPYGSQWENMTWGHSVSPDMIHWLAMPAAIEPDALGTIFSGSAVVDVNNTSGYGKGVVVALFTSAGRNQTQSMAYSTDDGRMFTKYVSNPVITGNVNDFRDPKAFWNKEAGMWNLILAAGQEVRLYSSRDLKEWKYESSFGEGHGCHSSVWECPDLMELDVRGTGRKMWLMIVNNGGAPAGGSGTQYFVGEFDGHEFKTSQVEAQWMDYGKDHYATVTFDNAPGGRKIAMAWMSNWEYSGGVPTLQFRSADSVPRDLDIFEHDGKYYCGVTPSPELLALRGKVVKKPTEACEIVVDLKKSATMVLSNPAGEEVVMEYDSKAGTFSMDRTRSGETSFHKGFPTKTVAPLHGPLRQVRIFIDRSSIEAFDSEGKMAMTNLVFPSEPYDSFSVKGGKAVIYSITE